MSSQTNPLSFVAIIPKHSDIMNSCDIERREREREERSPLTGVLVSVWSRPGPNY